MTKQLSSNSVTQPVMFIPHGAGPCFFMDWQPANMWDDMAIFLKSIPSFLPQRPKAIIVISAHWETAQFTVTSGKQPDLIYDYYGFPEHTYKLTYPANGAPKLAKRVSQLLTNAGLRSEQDATRGFDHGMFIPLKLMFPDADIPVVQLSVRSDLDPQAHMQAGKAIATLRKEGVLIIGSGMSFHNMQGFRQAQFTKPSEVFDQWLSTTVSADSKERAEKLRQWSHAPHAIESHLLGEEEHLIPLMITAGAAENDLGRKVFSTQVLKTQVSAFMFG